MDFLIREMKIEDVPEVCSLGLGQKEFTTDSASFWNEEQLGRWCESSHDILLVAEKDGKIVGFSFYAVHLPTGKVTWENLYVAPEVRSLGIAKALIEEGLKRIKGFGYSYVMLCVNAEDQGAFVSLVEKYGFKKWNTVLWMDKII